MSPSVSGLVLALADPLAGATISVAVLAVVGVAGRELMSAVAVGLTCVVGADSLACQDVDRPRHDAEMGRVLAATMKARRAAKTVRVVVAHVVDVVSVWDRAVGQTPSGTVCDLGLVTANADLTVAVGTDRRSPRPAVADAAAPHFGPVSIFNGLHVENLTSPMGGE